MKKKYLTALELVFFAIALYFFIPEIKSDPSPYSYVRPTLIVLVAMTISRAFAYRNGRSAVICVLETVLLGVAYIGVRMSLNVIVGQPVLGH